MWQKARIVDLNFRPVSQIGRELWVLDRPFEAEYRPLKIDGEKVLSVKDDEEVSCRGQWMMTNLAFPDGRCCRIWKDSIELLAEFEEEVSRIDVNTGEALIWESAS